MAICPVYAGNCLLTIMYFETKIMTKPDPRVKTNSLICAASYHIFALENTPCGSDSSVRHILHSYLVIRRQCCAFEHIQYYLYIIFNPTSDTELVD